MPVLKRNACRSKYRASPCTLPLFNIDLPSLNILLCFVLKEKLESMKKKWLLALGILFLIGVIAAVLIYIFVYNKPQPNYAKKDADYTIKATELFREFRENASKASTKYTGKVLAVEGVLSAVENSNSQIIAVFALADGIFGDEGIRCAFIPEHADEAIETPPGTAVIIKGYCTGYNDTDVIMEHCSMVK